MVEGITDSRRAVPFQTVQEIADRMEPVPARYDVDRFFDQLLGSDAVGLLEVKMDVVQVVIFKPRPGTSSVPSVQLYDIDPLRQFIEADCSAEQRIIGQDRLRVCDEVPDLPLVRYLQEIPDRICRHVRREGRQRCVESGLCRRT